MRLAWDGWVEDHPPPPLPFSGMTASAETLAARSMPGERIREDMAEILAKRSSR